MDLDQVLGWLEAAQRLAHLRERALDTCEQAAIGAGLTRLLDPLGEATYLCLERLDRPAGHGFLQHHADLGEVVAQGFDRLVEAAGLLELLDLRVDLSQQLLQTGQILRACPRQ